MIEIEPERAEQVYSPTALPEFYYTLSERESFPFRIRGGTFYWVLGLFCTGVEPVERVCSASSALFKTKSNLLACLLKLFTRLIRERTKARNIKNPKLNNKFRSTTEIR